MSIFDSKKRKNHEKRWCGFGVYTSRESKEQNYFSGFTDVIINLCIY